MNWEFVRHVSRETEDRWNLISIQWCKYLDKKRETCYKLDELTILEGLEKEKINGTSRRKPTSGIRLKKAKKEVFK